MVVSREEATVYRGGGRRWLTQQAAYRAAAKAKIKSICECEQPDTLIDPSGYPGFTCSYHKDIDRFQKIVRRLVGLYRASDRRSLTPAEV